MEVYKTQFKTEISQCLHHKYHFRALLPLLHHPSPIFTQNSTLPNKKFLPKTQLSIFIKEVVQKLQKSSLGCRCCYILRLVKTGGSTGKGVQHHRHWHTNGLIIQSQSRVWSTWVVPIEKGHHTKDTIIQFDFVYGLSPQNGQDGRLKYRMLLHCRHQHAL